MWDFIESLFKICIYYVNSAMTETPSSLACTGCVQKNSASEDWPRVSDMVRAPQASDRSCCSVHHRLQTTELVRRDADQRDVAVIKPAQYQCDDKRLVDGRRD